MQWIQATCVFAVALGVCGTSPAAGEDEPSARPNVVLMMADDVGWSDLGSYGSEIRTPNLDRLAQQGLSFTQFYNMAKCETTRATLLSGLMQPRAHAKRAQALPALMRQAGYYTAVSGKEHFMEWVPKHFSFAETFDDSFFFPLVTEYFVPPDGTFNEPFYLNGQRIDPEDMDLSQRPFYKTDAITDYALQFLNKAKDTKKPFFLYLPYHAAHYPLQAREEDIARYEGKYADGWDALRERRFARQKELGVLPPGAKLSPPSDNIYPHRGGKEYAKYTPWDQTPQSDRADLAREMAVYAAMIDRLDQNIGRVLKHLEATGAADNTLVIFLNDNGGCPFDNGTADRETGGPIGSAGSYEYLHPEWACATNTPWRYFKQYGHEGGCRTPLIARWPCKIKPGRTDQIGHVADIMPTMLQLAGTHYPDTVQGQPTPELDGESLLPIFEGKQWEEPRFLISGRGGDKRMVRLGDWKIVRAKNRPWELYNMTDDPAELDNLADEHPDKVQTLAKRYRQWLKNADP